ncbi:polysaccharide biosynthesis protein [Planococcus kocurii]|uniref:polysaccharide biosynthesis protein n=1 Tax=Planococcus kocurii TaxID=1374 RepID=UPI003D0199FB
MKISKQQLLGNLHRCLIPVLVLFRHFHTFVLVGFENLEEKMEHVVLPQAPHLTDKIVMVIGAGGMIGSEISRQLIHYQPARILLLGHGPQSIYSVEYEVRKLMKRQTEIIPIILNIQDKKRLFEAVERYKPDIIYHTDGQQQIDVTEEMPLKAVYISAFGTKNSAEAATRYHVDAFVLVSSEHAAKPLNLKEANKRLAEIIINTISTTSLTRYVIIRLPAHVFKEQLPRNFFPLFEQKTKTGYAVQHILHGGGLKTAIGKSSLFQLQGKSIYKVLQKSQGLSQLDMARLLKQLKTASEDEARKLVISIIEQQKNF